MRIKILLLIFGFLGSNNLKAQEFFDLNIDTISYQNLSGGTLLFPASNWDAYESAQVNLGFDFPFLDTIVRTVKLEASGRLVFDAQHHYWVDLNTIAWLRAATGISSSPVKVFHQSLSDGSKKVVLQFENARFEHQVSKEINFQIALFEKDGSISFHMGPRDSIATQDLSMGPFLAYAKLKSFSPLVFEKYHCWYGSLSELQDTLISQRGLAGFQNYELLDLWPENTRIQLIPKQVVGSVKPRLKTINYRAEESRVYLPEGRFQFAIAQMDGRIIQQGEALESFPVNDLQPGLYLIYIYAPNYQQSLKIKVS